MSRLFQNIAFRTRRIEEPTSYYGGISPLYRELPYEIVVFNRTFARQFAPHRDLHDRFMLVNCLDGKGGVILDGQLLLLKPGDSVLIFPYQEHHCANFETKAICWLFIGFNLRDYESLMPLRGNVISLTMTLGRLLERILDCHQAQARAQFSQAKDASIWLSLFLAALLRDAHAQPIRSGKSLPEPSDWRQNLIRAIGRYIVLNLGKKIAVSDLARHVAISESHLRRIFRQTMGISLGRYLRRMRVSVAGKMLYTSSLNIAEVAEKCGFSSQYAFSRTFRKLTRLSPSRYRAKARGNGDGHGIST